MKKSFLISGLFLIISCSQSTKKNNFETKLLNTGTTFLLNQLEGAKLDSLYITKVEDVTEKKEIQELTNLIFNEYNLLIEKRDILSEIELAKTKQYVLYESMFGKSEPISRVSYHDMVKADEDHSGFNDTVHIYEKKLMGLIESKQIADSINIKYYKVYFFKQISEPDLSIIRDTFSLFITKDFKVLKRDELRKKINIYME